MLDNYFWLLFPNTRILCSNLIGFMILIGLQRSTKLDGGKDANEPFLHMVFLQDFLGGSLFGYFGWIQVDIWASQRLSHPSRVLFDLRGNRLSISTILFKQHIFHTQKMCSPWLTEELTKMTFEDNPVKTMQYALDLVVIIRYTFHVAVTSHSVF